MNGQKIPHELRVVLEQHDPAEALAELTRRRKAAAKHRMQTVYRHDPVTFAKECFIWPEGMTLADYQADILQKIVIEGREGRRVSVRSPRGAGKTTTAALAILWYALTRDGDDWKVITTAGSWDQLNNYLWPEVHKWSRKLRWERVGRSGPFDSKFELMKNQLKLTTGLAVAAAPDKPELIEGAHADHLMFVFDEAKAIPIPLWDAMEGALSGTGEVFGLTISSPGEPTGRFYQIQSQQYGFDRDWYVRPIRLEETLAANRVSAQWAENKKAQYGPEGATYKQQVLGEFSTIDESSIFRLEWIEQAQDRWRAWRRTVPEVLPKEMFLTAIGIDVARAGPDRNAYALRKDSVLLEVITDQEPNTMTMVGTVKRLLHAHKGVGIVDVVAVGGGPFDRMRELELDVVPFNASSKCQIRDRSGELGFKNLRAAAWWHLRDLLNPVFGSDICLPPDEELKEELMAVHRKNIDSSAEIAVESKAEITKRLGRSPDKADAVMMAFSLPLFDGYGPITVRGGNPDDETRKREDQELDNWLEQHRGELLVEDVEAECGWFPDEFGENEFELLTGSQDDGRGWF